MPAHRVLYRQPKTASYLQNHLRKPPLMKKTSFFIILFLLSCGAFAQSPVHIGLFGGISNYQGDLATRNYQQSKPAFGVSLNYEVSDRVMLRGGLSFAKIAGADKYGKSEFLKENRNLSFESNITELSLIGELTAFNLYNIRWSPYVFGGLALFHYNPYTFDTANTKFFLKPLSTEGQGLSPYPDRKPYSLTQLALPFGGGIKYVLTDNIRIALEIGIRKTFTDYLDDVSGTYPDKDVLGTERGPKAVELSYRGGEVPGEYGTTYTDNGYPAKGVQRGSAKFKDYYYFTGLHITFRLGGDGGRGGRGGYGCPANPL